MEEGYRPVTDIGKLEGLPEAKDMSPSQRRALNLAIEGKSNIFITGGAGTGKSAVTRKIIQVLQDVGRNVLACAPTGVAAMNIEGGMTVHAAFGFSAGPCLETNWKSGKLELKTGSTRMLMMADVCVIDEVSMVSPS